MYFNVWPKECKRCRQFSESGSAYARRVQLLVPLAREGGEGCGHLVGPAVRHAGPPLAVPLTGQAGGDHAHTEETGGERAQHGQQHRHQVDRAVCHWASATGGLCVTSGGCRDTTGELVTAGAGGDWLLGTARRWARVGAGVTVRVWVGIGVPVRYTVWVGIGVPVGVAVRIWISIGARVCGLAIGFVTGVSAR